jgi:hypothetical protein
MFRQPPEQHPDLELAASTSAQPQSQNSVQDDYVNMAAQCQEHITTADSAETASVVIELQKMQNTVYEDHLNATPHIQPENAGQLEQSNLSDHSTDQTEHVVSDQEESPSLDCNDPVKFCGRRLKSVDINTLLDAGPCQPMKDYNFPVVANRSFNPDWFSCCMPDNTTYQRKWLIYSKSVNRAYCLPCIAFSGPRGSDLWTNTGFSDWHNGVRDVQRHECCSEHRAAEIAMQQWRRGCTVSHMIAGNRNALIEDNRKVMECVIDCVRFLTAQMLAFWGNDSHDGKFISIFKLIAKRDSTAAAYLQKIDQVHREGKKMGINFISPGMIGNVLKAMKLMVTEKIVQSVRCKKKACIIFDSTQDYSKREASVLLVRYMEDDGNGELCITERLLEVFTTGETSGAVLTDHVLADLQRLNVELEWIVGQCYDGAGNMRGRYSGMATHIQARCQKAVYIWCHAHRLNLVVNAVAVCSPDVRNTLGLLEELYVFMTGHKRNDVFRAKQGDTGERVLQLKRVSTTRWNSSQAAVDTVLSRFSAIMQALSHLSDSKYDSETITQASGLRSRLNDIRVILCMHILRIVYHIIGPASRSLQGIATDLGCAAVLLSDCKRQFENLRTDAEKQWETVCAEAVDFATAHGVSCQFPAERRRRKKRMDDELSSDQCLSGQERMKVDTFIVVIDEVIQLLQSRFS